jgi:hypothetical protein
MLPVVSYSARWDATNNRGRMLIQIGTSPATPVPIDNPDEFAIMLLMMNRSGVMFDTQTREIEIPVRPVGT